jgi:beta-phosphoglucomutase
LLVNYDKDLKAKFTNELEDAYAEYIQTIRETYGGIMARQKLNNIFSHLKGIDLYQSVIEKVKRMEKSTEETQVPATRVIKGFVFDLDGVIVDTAIHHFQSWKKIMKELGVEIADSDDLHTRGAGRMESLEYLLQQYKIQLTDEQKQYWAARKNDIYVEAINGITPHDLLPGALSFLKASRSQGLLLALGSASKNARPVLKKLGVEEYFDAILDGNSAKESKPHPEIFLNACTALGLDPKSVVVFEDAAKGIQAALGAGCYAVGIGDPVSLSAAQIVIPGLDHASPSNIIDQLI